MLELIKNDTEYNKPNIPLRIVLTIIAIIFIYTHFIAFDNTKFKNVDMKPFSEPIQENIENGQPFEHKVKDGIATITPLANYKIYGRVYDRHYRPYKMYLASVYPYDISIGFGDFQYKEVYKAVSVKMAATISYYSYSNSAYQKHLSKYFREKGMDHYFTNTHLCPANKNIRRGLSKLRKKDIVYLEGYLIKFELNRKDGRYETGISSTSRDDSLRGDNGNGNCEQIYVTRVVSRHGDYR